MEREIEPKFRETMRAIATALDQMFNENRKGKDRAVGFMLLVFDFACPPGARTNYISNCDPADGINAMKEFIARAEGNIADSEQLQ